MTSSSSTDIVDFIYEAAVLPDLWPLVLDRIARVSETVGGALIAIPPTARELMPSIVPKIRWTTSTSVEDLFSAFFKEGWVTRCAWVQRGRSLEHPGFVTDQDLFQPGELETMPTYPFYRSHGIGWATALFARVPSSDTFTFTFDRRFEDGPISAETVATLNTLRPHLARAALISCRLGLERAQASAQALNIIGLPAAVLCPSHKIIAANERMQALMPTHVTERAKGRFQLVEQRADDLLSKALAALHLPTDRQDHLQSRSIPIASKSDYVPMVAHVVPIRRSATDIFVNASSIVVITPVCETELPCANVIQGLFDLTAAETRVARMIAGGGTVSAIAASSETTEGTVRNQLKSVFSKTGVSRQADLVSLLNSTKLGGRG